MPRRRSQRSRRTPPGALWYEVTGWFTSATKQIKVSDLHIDNNARPFRPLRARFTVNAVSSTTTYMVPSNYPSVQAVLVDAKKLVIAIGGLALTSSSATRCSVSAPRMTDYGQYSANGVICQITATASPANTTVSYTGSLLIQFSPRDYVAKVTLESYTLRLTRLTLVSEDDDEAAVLC